MKTTKKAKVKSSGVTIEVYKLNNGKWCDADNCTTQYNESDLIFI